MKKIQGVLTAFLLLSIVLIFCTNDRTQIEAMKLRDEIKQPIFRVEKEEKEIALTFDVNWAEKDNLISILDILDKYNIKATFFIMGGWVNYCDENVEKLKEICKRENEIGNHSYIHPNFKNISVDRINSEIKKTEDIIYKNTGQKTSLFRCPSGAYNEHVLENVEKLGYKTIQWDVDSVDWKELGQEQEYNKVIKNVKNGSIVLFHNNAKYTPKNLDLIIKKLKDEGYNFVKVGDLIYKDGYKIDENGTQIKENNAS